MCERKSIVALLEKSKPRTDCHLGCRKGKRECEYPDHPSSAKSDRTSTRTKRPNGDSNSENSDDDSEHLPTITDEDEFDEGDPRSALSDPGMRLPSSRDGKSTPTTEYPSILARAQRPQANRSNSKQSMKDDITQSPRWAGLPERKVLPQIPPEQPLTSSLLVEIRRWRLPQKTFLEIAINFEPLLYAVVAFAAYHYAISREDGRVKDFLDAYNKSVSALRHSLAKTDRHSLSTLLTILQLATIEVC